MKALKPIDHAHYAAEIILLAIVWSAIDILAGLVVRPIFEGLLDRVPRYAAKAKKKRKIAAMMQNRVVSLLHTLIQVPLALAILFSPYYQSSPLSARDHFSTLVMIISSGYFLYDIFECLIRQEGMDFVIHGVCGFLASAIAVHSGYLHYYGAGFLMWELSTPFLHMRWVLKSIGKDGSKFYAFNALAGMFVFFCCRVVWGNILTWMLWRDSYIALHAVNGADLPLMLIWYYRVATATMSVMNAWWFSKMVRMLIEAVSESRQGAAKAA